MLLRHRNKHILKKVGHKMSLLDVSQWLYAYAFMCLWWRRWIWVIQFWNGCVRKMSLSVLRRAACSKPWKDATDGEAGWDEGKVPPGVICGPTRPVSLLVVSRGRRGVGEGVAFGSSPPFLIPLLTGFGKCWNHQNHRSTHKIVCNASGGWDGRVYTFMPVIGSVQNSLLHKWENRAPCLDRA